MQPGPGIMDHHRRTVGMARRLPPILHAYAGPWAQEFRRGAVVHVQAGKADPAAGSSPVRGGTSRGGRPATPSPPHGSGSSALDRAAICPHPCHPSVREVIHPRVGDAPHCLHPQHSPARHNKRVVPHPLVPGHQRQDWQHQCLPPRWRTQPTCGQAVGRQQRRRLGMIVCNILKGGGGQCN